MYIYQVRIYPTCICLFNKAIEDGNLEELEQKKKKRKSEIGNQNEVETKGIEKYSELETKERSESPIPSVCYIRIP